MPRVPGNGGPLAKYRPDSPGCPFPGAGRPAKPSDKRRYIPREGRIAGLRTRGHGTDLDETETEGGQSIDMFAVLVETRRQADRVGKNQSHHLPRVRRHRGSKQTARARGVEEIDAAHPDKVGGFGVESEEKAT